MEGKALLFKEFAGVDAFPLCLATQDADEIVETAIRVAPVFGGINLEDIAAPRCFEIEQRLQEALDIPVFHDDQHGTAIVVQAALFNALKVVGKPLEGVRIVIMGAGAAGVATTKALRAGGAQDIVRVMATGRSDYPNQINNVLAFPGVFRGALDAQASAINDEMKLAAAHAIADSIGQAELNEDYIIPSVFNLRASSRSGISVT